MARPGVTRPSRTSSVVWATCTSRASTRWGAAAWPGRSWRRPSSSQPDHYVPGVADSKVLDGRGARAPLRRDRRRRRRAGRSSIVERRTRSIASTSTARRSQAMRAGRDGAGAAARASCWSTGSAFPISSMAQRSVIGGDRRSTAIAAASILAKVTRDRMMGELHVAIRATGSIATRATRRAITSTPSAGSAIRRCIAGRSGRRRCLIKESGLDLWKTPQTWRQRTVPEFSTDRDPTPCASSPVFSSPPICSRPACC